MNYWKLLLIGLSLISLTACTVPPTTVSESPNSNQQQDPPHQSDHQDTTPETYTVQKGDGVFSIMRKTGVYWKDIIEMNDLKAPDYIIVPGQVLILKDAVKQRDVTTQ